MLLTILLLSETGAAQSKLFVKYIAVKEVDAAATQIAVEIPDDSPITKIRLNGETGGNSLVKDVSAVKTFLMTVELIGGENVFNIVGYADNKIVYSTENPIIIVRKKSAATNASVGNSSSSAGAFSFSQSSNASQSSTGINQANDKKLRLVGKGSVRNQETYNFVIDASDMPPQTGNYTIEIKNTDKKGKETVDSETRKIEFDAGINRHKQLQSVEVKLREGTNVIAVTPRVEGQNFVETAQLAVECTVCKDEPASSESVVIRSIIGLEQVGASSARSEQRPFLSLFFNTPVNAGTKMVCPEGTSPQKGQSDCTGSVPKIPKPKFAFSVWGDIRMTTTAVQSIGSLAGFTPAGFAANFVQGDSAGKVNDLVRSFDFLVGFDKEIVKLGKRFDGVFPGRTSLSFIAAGGAITPLSSDKGALFFKVPTETEPQNAAFFKAFPEAAGKKNIAFVASERSRFFRHYYAGFRLKTFFDDKEIKYVPAMFDVTFGQNEAITNRLQGIVMRLDAVSRLESRFSLLVRLGQYAARQKQGNRSGVFPRPRNKHDADERRHNRSAARPRAVSNKRPRRFSIRRWRRCLQTVQKRRTEIRTEKRLKGRMRRRKINRNFTRGKIKL